MPQPTVDELIVEAFWMAESYAGYEVALKLIADQFKKSSDVLMSLRKTEKLMTVRGAFSANPMAVATCCETAAFPLHFLICRSANMLMSARPEKAGRITPGYGYFGRSSRAKGRRD